MAKNDKRQQQQIGAPPAQERGQINVGKPRQGFQQLKGPTIDNGPTPIPAPGPNATPIGGRSK